MDDFMNEIKRKTKALKEWNKKWEKINAPIVKHNNRGIAFERNDEIKKAIVEYEKCLRWMYDHFDGEYLKQIAWHSPNRLRILYKKEKHPREKEFLQEFTHFCFDHGIEYPEIFQKQLSGDNSKKNIRINEVIKSDIEILPIDNFSISKQIEDQKKSMPEFDFYYKMPEGMQTHEYLMSYRPVPFEDSVRLGNLRNKLKGQISDIKENETNGNLKTAIEQYEKLVTEGVELKEPYDRLMLIYRKLGWKEDELRITKIAINYFKELNKKQRENILRIASKYGMTEKAFEYLNAGKKIWYYGGAFELYNPMPFIEVWEKRFENLNK